MKVIIHILLFFFYAAMAQAQERHSFGYSVGINDPEDKKGLLVEIKVGFAKEYDPKYDSSPNKITTIQEGFKVYTCWPARRADEDEIEQCDVKIRHIFVPIQKSKEFERTFSYVRPELEARNPFTGPGNVLDIRDVGNPVKGILWVIDGAWVIVMK